MHLLSDARIDARVLNEHAQGGVGQLPVTDVYPEVWVVEDADFKRARELLVAFERRRVSEETVTCSGCGERNPSTFEICWHCGEPLA